MPNDYNLCLLTAISAERGPVMLLSEDDVDALAQSMAEEIHRDKALDSDISAEDAFEIIQKELAIIADEGNMEPTPAQRALGEGMNNAGFFDVGLVIGPQDTAHDALRKAVEVRRVISYNDELIGWMQTASAILHGAPFRSEQTRGCFPMKGTPFFVWERPFFYVKAWFEDVSNSKPESIQQFAVRLYRAIDPHRIDNRVSACLPPINVRHAQLINEPMFPSYF